jgi:hypothetical protein
VGVTGRRLPRGNRAASRQVRCYTATIVSPFVRLGRTHEHIDASSLACLLRDQRYSRRYCYKSRKLKKFTSPHSIILIGAGEHRL